MMGIGKSYTCARAREIDIVAYLQQLGIAPAKIRGAAFWYYSPFRDERTPSFKVDRRRNRYYDFGEGKGGSFIDLAIRLEDCTVGELLAKLGSDFSFQRHRPLSEKLAEPERPIAITRVRVLSNGALLSYLGKRRIPIALADRFLKEVHFTLHDKHYFAVGFANDLGGWELRNSYFKGSNQPKGISTFLRGNDTLCVFEGFMDFLSFLTLVPGAESYADLLVLNSLSHFEAARVVMERYEVIQLYLDNDTAGQNVCTYASSLHVAYVDKRGLYRNYKDLNDFLCRIPKDAGPSKEDLPP